MRLTYFFICQVMLGVGGAILFLVILSVLLWLKFRKKKAAGNTNKNRGVKRRGRGGGREGGEKGTGHVKKSSKTKGDEEDFKYKKLDRATKKTEEEGTEGEEEEEEETGEESEEWLP